MGTPYSARILEDVDLLLKALENFYQKNGAAVEGLADRNGHRRKLVGEEKKCQLGEINGPKLRGASVNSSKICSCTVIC